MDALLDAPLTDAIDTTTAQDTTQEGAQELAGDAPAAQTTGTGDPAQPNASASTTIPAEDKVDGRKFNPEWSRALKALRESHPEHADMLTKLRDEYARQQEFRSLAPKGLEDVRGWKTVLDAAGGAEAVADLQQRAANYDAIDAKILAGDVTVVDDLPAEMQNGLGRVMLGRLDSLAQSMPQEFNAAVAPMFQSALAATGLGDVVAKLQEVVGENPEAQAILKSVADWFGKQTSGAAGAGQGAPGQRPQQQLSPEMKRLQEENAALKQSRADEFSKSIADTNVKYRDTGFEREIGVYRKQLNLTDAQVDDLRDSFNARVAEKIKSDPAFTKQLNAYAAMKSPNPETINTYISNKLDEIMKPALDALVTARYGGQRRQAAPAATPAAPSANGVTRVSQRPAPSEWDMEKMRREGEEKTVDRGIFHLRGGRTVQLVRGA